MSKQTLIIALCTIFSLFAGIASAQEDDIAPPKITCYIRCHVSPHERSDQIYKSAECTSCHNTVAEHKKERSIWENLPFRKIASLFKKTPSAKPGEERFKIVENQADALARLYGRKPAISPPSLKAPPGMIHIPAGEFIMGSNDRWEDERPEYVVFVDDFFIDRYEVTNKQYKEFVDATSHKHPKHWKDGSYPEGMDNYPVVYVTHPDAAAYAAWAGKRLPLEEEWEKAARGPDGRTYPWGMRFDPEKSNNPQKGSDGPEAVGSYEAGKSFYGIYDMSGNVWEWVDGFYLPHPGNEIPNPQYGKNYRLAKGGSWFNCLYYNCGISAPMYNRAFFLPTTQNASMGFRCVIPVGKEERRMFSRSSGKQLTYRRNRGPGAPAVSWK